MTDVFLGTIAASVLVMAIIQVSVIVWAARTARRVGDVVARLERDVRPIVASLEAMAADAARISASAASQVERADRLLGALGVRLDETVRSLQEGILSPVRELLSMLQMLRDTLFGAGRHGAGADPRRRQPVEEEDALFIG